MLTLHSPADLIDGKSIAKTIREELAEQVQQLKSQHNKVSHDCLCHSPSVQPGHLPVSKTVTKCARCCSGRHCLQCCLAGHLQCLSTSCPAPRLKITLSTSLTTYGHVSNSRSRMLGTQLSSRTTCTQSSSEVSCWRLQVPGLAVVLVGTRKDSESYVRNKKKACEDVGIKSFGRELPEDVSEEEVLKVSMQADMSATKLSPSSPLVDAIAACAGTHCMSTFTAICPRLVHCQQQHILASPSR